jgi:cytochrome c oxidase cbb3-type subunit I/II
MIRPFRSETERYGEYSKAGEFVYDHPFQFGSKRTGPDIQREGGKYPDSWHYNHMLEPTSMSPGSIMPAYPNIIDHDLDITNTEAKIKAMQMLGVPYPKGYEKLAAADVEKQSLVIQASLAKDGIKVSKNKEIIAVIAYLQRLGKDIKNTPKTAEVK